MLDKNGVEIKTGDVVEITGAYFKNDNGFYYVENSAGDPGWSGSDHCLRKISKRGKISKAKRNICFWPIGIFTNSFETRVTAKAWNKEHATIEVRTDIDRGEIAQHFKDMAESMDGEIEFYAWHFGEESETVKKYREIKMHLEKAYAMILSENTKEDKIEEIPEAKVYSAEKKTDPMQKESEQENAVKQEISRKYYPVNEEMARYAKMANSFHDYKPVEATKAYQYYCDKVYDLVEQIQEEKPELLEKALGMADYYFRKLATYYNDYYRNEASCPSVMISGPANFPVKKKEKQNNRRDALHKTWEYLENYAEKIEKLLRYEQPILSKNENAAELIQEKIQKLEQEKELMKNINKYYRKNKTIKGYGKEIPKEFLSHINFMVDQKWDSRGLFDTTNTNAEINRLKSRLKSIQATKEAGQCETVEHDQEGDELFKVVRNTEIMRLQLFFDGKPSDDVRCILKKNGFKWSPKNMAWQRQLTGNALRSLVRVKEEILKIA